MEERKNLCAMLPVALHARVRQEQEKAGMTLSDYIETMITEYYDWKDGKIMTREMRTLAAQIPAELFDRLDRCGGKPLLQAVSRHAPACRLFCVSVGTLHQKP